MGKNEIEMKRLDNIDETYDKALNNLQQLNDELLQNIKSKILMQIEKEPNKLYQMELTSYEAKLERVFRPPMTKEKSYEIADLIDYFKKIEPLKLNNEESKSYPWATISDQFAKALAIRIELQHPGQDNTIKFRKVKTAIENYQKKTEGILEDRDPWLTFLNKAIGVINFVCNTNIAKRLTADEKMIKSSANIIENVQSKKSNP